MINLPGISDNQFTAAHGDEEKRLLYPEITSWVSVEERAEYERCYPFMPSRIIDNLTESKAKISVAPWDRINEKTLKFLIEATFCDRKNCEYNLRSPMKRRNS